MGFPKKVPPGRVSKEEVICFEKKNVKLRLHTFFVIFTGKDDASLVKMNFFINSTFSSHTYIFGLLLCTCIYNMLTYSHSIFFSVIGFRKPSACRNSIFAQSSLQKSSSLHMKCLFSMEGSFFLRQFMFR